MSSYTVSLTGNSSTLQSTLFPVLRLSKEKVWEAALLDLTTYNSIPNITEGINNKFHYYKTKDNKGNYSSLETVEIPTGSYEIDNINDLLQTTLGKDKSRIKGRNNKLKAEITSKFYIYININIPICCNERIFILLIIVINIKSGFHKNSSNLNHPFHFLF